MKLKINKNFNYKMKFILKKASIYLLLTSGVFLTSCNNKNKNTLITEENIINVDDNVSIDDNVNTDNFQVTNEFITNTYEVPTKIIEDNLEVVDERKIAALTFDDGPGIYTKELVDLLNEYDCHATFFVLGSNVERYGDSVKYAYDNKNEIGMHGYSHKIFTKMELSEIREEIVNTYNNLRDLDVEPSPLVRPPGGFINSNIIENLDYEFMSWNLDTKDWESRDKEQIKEQILSSINEGSIIIMHDIHRCTIDAMIELLPTLTKEYKFVTISELFDIFDNELDVNNSYRYVKIKKAE